MRINHMLKKLYQFALPYTCVFCHHPSGRTLDLCEACQQELPILTHSCSKCARPITETESICDQCLLHPPAYSRTYALFSYQDNIKRLILKLKFNQNLVVAKLLGTLLANKLKQIAYVNQPLPEVIIPIPLHAKRLKERGFNQSLEIGRQVAKILGIALESKTCYRVKSTAAQATLHAEQRKTNVADAFVIKRDYSSMSIAILDDVMTTGSTINEFAKTLKKAGADRIDVWCCARALL